MDKSISSNSYTSDNSEIVGSSQISNHKIKTKRLANLSKSKVKLNVNSEDSSLNPLNNRKDSLSDVVYNYEKEELSEMLNNINGYESIDMTHDLTGLIIDDKLSDFEDPLIIHSTQIEVLSNEQNPIKEEIQDPLYIDEKDKIEFNNKYVLRIRKKPISYTSVQNKSIKKIEKNQLKDQQNDEYLSDYMLKKLRSLKIILQHDVPPQHEISILSHMGKKKTKQFEAYCPLKRSPFTEGEDSVIKRNWIKFCNIHSWDKNIVQPFIYMKQNGKFYISSPKQRKKFVQFLANGLPWRSLLSVHYRFRNLYNCTKKGGYTHKENNIIYAYMKNNSNKTIKNKYAELGKILNRNRNSIAEHYKILQKNNYIPNSEINLDLNTINQLTSKMIKKENNNETGLSETIVHDSILSKESRNIKVQNTIKWTSRLVKKFIKILIEVTSCKNLNELKNKNINQKVWKKMEKILGIDEQILKNFWYLQLHMQLFCPTPLYLNDLKINLIEYIYKHNLENLENIAWDKICVNFNGVTKLFLSQLFHGLIEHAKLKTNLHDIKDNVEYLYKRHICELEEKTVDILLPKLKYESGIISCLDKGTEKKIPDRFIIDPFNNDDDY